MTRPLHSKTPFIAAFAQSMFLVVGIVGCHEAEPPAEHHSAASHAHAPHEHHSPGRDAGRSVKPPAGERSATDEPLRLAMTRIRAAIEEARENGTPDVSGAQPLAHTIEEEVTYMIENCKLPPRPDAALHVLIARMMSAADELKESPADRHALATLASVLDEYGEIFDHPGWTARSASSDSVTK